MSSHFDAQHGKSRGGADDYPLQINMSNNTGDYLGHGQGNASGSAQDSSNGQGRFLGSLPDNAKLSQTTLPQGQEGPLPGNDLDNATRSLGKEIPQGSPSKPSKPQRICTSCGNNLTGQFVRALEGTYHLECFKCNDCGDIVASKFFPADKEDGPGQYPLCERDYFRRLDLLCNNCGEALRGSYVTALEKKYHIDHFTCSICPTAFGARDSYYEHDGDVYCHYHYSTHFAQRCNGCQTAILKQFVEIFRNGQNQHWHPECYMIHKFWSVKLISSSSRGDLDLQPEEDPSEETRNQIRIQEEDMEEKTYRIWSVLSAFEETSAACISDMLLHVSNGAYMEGVLVAKKFIQHVDVLFGATDGLDTCVIQRGMPGLSYGREAKLLCKRIVAFFTLLTKTQDNGVKRLGVTQELLSLVTGLAHYLKLLIRISLQGALRLEKEMQTKDGLEIFLDDLSQLEGLKDVNVSLDETASLSDLADEQSDLCFKCQRPIDDECLKMGQQRCHNKHLHCGNCKREIGDNLGLDHAIWYLSEQKAYCPNCSVSYTETDFDFVPVERVTRLQQYVYLLRVALARLLQVLRNGGVLPHTSDDPSLNLYNSKEGHRLEASDNGRPSLSSDSRSKSYGGTSNLDQSQNQSSYSETVGEMKRLRSTRMDKSLSTSLKQTRRSRIIDPGKPNFHIEDEQDQNGQTRSDLNINRLDALTLDDIPRIVAAEQVKEQRPNAYRHAQNKLVAGGKEPKLLSGHQRGGYGSQDDKNLTNHNLRERKKKFFSELTALDYFIVRHVAVLQMQPLLEGHFDLEYLLSLIEQRKQTFWNKFFNKSNEKPKGGKKKGVFGVPLEVLVDRDGVESSHGIGPGALRVPGLLDDAVTAMRQMDMSVEGVFRKNGNIRGLKDLAERLDSKEGDVDLSKETPVQVAALLKKFLREMPDPLLTHKLHDIFTTAQKISDESKRFRVMHLTCCLLPKANRDSMEVLFAFLNWAASFSQVDDETGTGSKMDSHNIATVMAPNILSQDLKGVGMDESFLGIEAIHMLLDNHDQMCEVPEDIQTIMCDDTLFQDLPPEVTTKEILKRYDNVAKQPGRHYGSVRPEEADMPAMHSADHESPPPPRGGAPIPVRVNTDPSQSTAWQKESSVRHVQQHGAQTFPMSNQNTPPQQFQQEILNQHSPYQPRASHEMGRNYPAPKRYSQQPPP